MLAHYFKYGLSARGIVILPKEAKETLGHGIRIKRAPAGGRVSYAGPVSTSEASQQPSPELGQDS